MFDPQIAGCESANNNDLYHPWVKPVLQQIRYIVAGCEKLLQKLVSSSTALCNLQKLDLLHGKIDLIREW